MRREGNEAAWFTGYSATLKRNVGRKHVGRGCLTTTLLFLIRSLVRSHTIGAQSRPQASSQAPAHRRWSRAECHPAGAAPPAVAYPTCGCRLVPGLVDADEPAAVT